VPQLGIDVPTLCHDERLNRLACRLCVVEVKAGASAHTGTLVDGMEVRTRQRSIAPHAAGVAGADYLWKQWNAGGRNFIDGCGMGS
jgi:predicted molibdopterin-dependent oxidoreductase YjgC